MSVEELKNLKNNRKWYQFCKGIVKTINSENGGVIHDLYLDTIAQYHPISITECTLAISNLVAPLQAIALIDKSIEIIKECNMYTGDFSLQIVQLEIKKNLFRVQQNEFEGIERMLYELKHMDLPAHVYELYNFLGFKYFESTGNIDYCISYLITYIDLSQDQSYYDVLARYTLISKTFYNFMKVYSFKGFSAISLNKIYSHVQNGDTKSIMKEKDNLQKLFGDHHKTIIEKTYYVGLINLCFQERSRQISFGEIQKSLGIDAKDIHPFILRAFGLGLMQGWIDEATNTLYFSTILPRTLPNEELEKMKDKFVSWREKVGNAIAMIEK